MGEYVNGAFRVCLVGLLFVMPGLVSAKVPREYEAAQSCFHMAMGVEAVQTIRKGGYDANTGETVAAVPNRPDFDTRGLMIAEGNPVRQHEIEALANYTYSKIPADLDPENAAYIAFNECLFAEFEAMRRNPWDKRPPVDDTPKIPKGKEYDA